MTLNLFSTMSDNYRSNSQKIRVLTENWVNEHIYCPSCGCGVNEYENNRPVADFFCKNCNEDYELKSKNSKILGKTIADGAYNSMIDRITSETNPNFFFLNYDKNSYDIVNFLAVPSYLFVPNMIIPRKKGIPNRPNYIMCNIDISNIPSSGKTFYIKDKQVQSKTKILDEWNKISFLKESSSAQSKGWLLDIIKCIEKLEKENFSLNDMYQFEKYLKIRHPENNNIEAKIRQQLQILRDKNYLKFESRGKYILRK